MDDDRRADAEALTAAGERFDELADVAELMGDAQGAQRFRDLAATRYAEAMSVLDGGGGRPSS